MRITRMKTNHVENPVGFFMETPRFTWNLQAGEQEKVSTVQVAVWREGQDTPEYDSGEMAYTNHHLPKMDLSFETRYHWQVTVKDGQGREIAERAWFETGKEAHTWEGRWISPADGGHGVVFKDFEIEGKVERARLYITGVGLYEAYLDGEKIGDEYLTPNFNNYDAWIQYQTYVIPPEKLGQGSHRLRILLGDGWYKGRYMAFDPEKDRERYGNRKAALGELHLHYSGGDRDSLVTDASWRSSAGSIREDSIYDGEWLDDMAENSSEGSVEELALGFQRLTMRRSLPVVVKETRMPVGVIHTPKGETVLDFGQNMVGWIRFYNRLPRGGECRYQVGEILQDGCFFRENLRSAKAEFRYRSSGEEKWVRPHFTYYGFRYALLEGFGEEIRLEDFQADVLYSDLEQTGEIETSNPLVNQLISNVLWGQKGNFVDVPTDCPQRDERMGWTGDTQVFSRTAAYNMDVAAFFSKHMYDTYTEQRQNQGAVPFTVPNLFFGNQVSAAWSDMATIVPWNMYLIYGDKEMLREQYENMKLWTDYLYCLDEENGANRLWDSNGHFGDWLSLDDPGNREPIGGTDMTLIATAYYYFSVKLTRKAAHVLGLSEDEKRYLALEQEVKQAFGREYFTPSGRLALDTQTAYALVLYTGLYEKEQEQRLTDAFAKKMKENNCFLKTGFVGTPYLCLMLSEHGRNDLAYRLLLNQEYPSWLYAVNMGATTIWERWNSVLPDGHLNPEGMNSLNHYAYGSIQEWMYSYMLGIRPMEEAAGFQEFILNPMPDRRMDWARGRFLSAAGEIVSQWNYATDGELQYHFEIPYGSKAHVRLMDTDGNLRVNGETKVYPQEEHSVSFVLEAGVYDIRYLPYSSVGRHYSRDTDIRELVKDEEAVELLRQIVPGLLSQPEGFLGGSLEESVVSVFAGYGKKQLEELEEKLKELR